MTSLSPGAWRAIDWRSPAMHLAALLALSLTVGAGGIHAPFGNMMVQLAALAVLAMNGPALAAFVRAAPLPLRLLVIATFLLPLVQLVPLPPGIWPALPGRDLVAQSFELAGLTGWAPLSVAPSRTLLAALALLAPLALVAIGSGLGAGALIALQRASIALGLVTALFGVTHLLDERWGDLYAWQQAMPGVIVGTFADRNGYALFLVCCLLLVAGLPAPPRDRTAFAMRLAAAAFLALCVFLTGSRSGIALLTAPAILGMWRLLAYLSSARDARAAHPYGWAVGGLIVGALAVALVVTSGRGQASLERFDLGDGMRADMREDARYAAGRYWPAGAGMGTFDEVFQIDESLEFVSPRRAGRAHMDYLELAIEAGLAGLAIAGAWLAWAAWRAVHALRAPGAWPARAAALGLAAIAAQSVVSFPLRNLGMLCVAALLIVLLARSPVAALRGARP